MRIRQASTGMAGRSAREWKGRSRGGPPWKGLFLLLSRLAAVVAAVAVAAGLGYGGYRWITTTPLFSLQEVVVEGNHHLGRERIEEILGVHRGDNLISLDVGALGRRLRATGWIEGVSIHRRLPHGLVVKVRERRPVALARLRGETYLVDERGVLFRKVGPKERWPLPLITGLGPRSVKGMRLTSDALEVVKLLRLSKRRPSTLGIGNIREIRWSDDGGFLVYTGDLTLHFGPGDIHRQFARAERVLYHIYHSGLKGRIARVDLAYGPDLAWAKLKGGRARR